MAQFLWRASVGALAALGASSIVAAAASNTSSTATAQATPYFEIDVIFPRNETYKTSDIFPIALAIQNTTVLRSLGKVVVEWDIMPYDYGNVPGGVLWDQGIFTLPDGTADDNEPWILVGNSNVSSWIHLKDTYPQDRFMLQWVVFWTDYDDACGGDAPSAFGSGLMFSIETDYEETVLGEDAGIVPDVTQVPECPIFGTMVEISLNSTNATSCPAVVDENTGLTGNPCAVKINSGAASDIALLASSAASASILATALPTSTSSQTSTKNAAYTMIPSSPTNLVAVYVITYLVLGV
ncbi:hypothetical protein BX600DRAFT_474068 [Xylariales sp. PMI_506]|nr:hypothetical protein BX600DRAFT_474068 [Xylariales sp. PMI_506]